MRRLLWVWITLSTAGCEPAPLLVSLVDAGAEPAAMVSSSSAPAPSTSVGTSWAGSGSSGGASSSATVWAPSSAAPSSSIPQGTSGPLQGELAFPVAMQAGFFRVNDDGMTREYRVWMGDAAATCDDVEHLHAQLALNITFGTLEAGGAVAPGSYPVVPVGAPLPPGQRYASVWGWWNPPSQMSFLALSGSVEVTQASHNHVAGTLDVLMDRRDGSPASALRGVFETTCVQPVP